MFPLCIFITASVYKLIYLYSTHFFHGEQSCLHSHPSHASCDFRSKQAQRTWMAAKNVNRNSHANCSRALLYLEVEVRSVFGEDNLPQPRRKQKNNRHVGCSVCRGNPRCCFTIHWVHNNIGSKVSLLLDLGLLGRVRKRKGCFKTK